MAKQQTRQHAAMQPLNPASINLSGLNLIEASAGTGKTWTITALYILLILKRRIQPENILVVTYTRAATAELRERIRNRISATLELYISGREPADELEQFLVNDDSSLTAENRRLLARALYSFDNAAIFTIHGFCQRSLLENAFESGSLLDSEMASDQSALVGQICDDFWRATIMTGQEEFLRQLIARGYTPASLASPFRGHFQNPFLEIIPDGEELDLGPIAANARALQAQLAGIWKKERREITGQLEQGQLKQTAYKPQQIEAAALKMDQWLQGNRLDAPDGLSLFTPDKIEKNMKKDSRQPDHLFFKLWGGLEQAVARLEQSFHQTLISCQRQLHGYLQQELHKRKQAMNLKHFDDLLLEMYTAMEADNGGLAKTLRNRYQAALIDEFQDTDPLQWRILARLAGIDASPANAGREEYPLFLIGDPKQAIYSFRGADIHAYIAAAQASSPERRWTLDTNRRSSKALVAAVNTLFKSENPFINPQIAFHPVGSGRSDRHQLLQDGQPVTSPLRFRVLNRDGLEKTAVKGLAHLAIAEDTAATITGLLNDRLEIITKDGIRRRLRPEDIAVLVRTHQQSQMIQNSLNRLAIPSVQHGSATIFESREAREILCILRAAANPAHGAMVREALLTGLIGMNANQLHDLQNNPSAWDDWLTRFKDLNQAANSGGVIALGAQLLGECGVRGNALSRPNGDRILTNLLHCLELIHQAERENSLPLDACISWLQRQISANQGDDACLLRLETDENAVSISTIHASKGLEYPVVFLPFSGDVASKNSPAPIFHGKDGRLTCDLGSDQIELHQETAREEALEEAARLFYVAATRAEFLCFISWGCINGYHESPLARLLHNGRGCDSKSFTKLADSDLMDDIKTLAEQARQEYGLEAIACSFIPARRAEKPVRTVSSDTPEALVCRELKNPLNSSWRISSFTSISGVRERHHQNDDSQTSNVERPGEPSLAGNGMSIFDFPRGAEAGNCLHELFERLDFSTPINKRNEDEIGACLERYGYNQQWLETVKKMLGNVCNAQLLPDQAAFSLSRLQPGKWQTELEFYLPLGLLNENRLQESFAGILDPSRHGRFSEELKKLRFQESCGMLHGFIDMLFEHDGRFYIIDWKSNHLGFRNEDYGTQQMLNAMVEHAYILQYHIYTLALDRLLRQRIAGYDYSSHFGGILYLFIRGVDDNAPGCGIFHDRPEEEFILQANRLLLGQADSNQ